MNSLTIFAPTYKYTQSVLIHTESNTNRPLVMVTLRCAQRKTVPAASNVVRASSVTVNFNLTTLFTYMYIL